MKSRFYIERRLDDSGNLILKDRPIFMSVSFEGKRIMLGTGMKADFNSWDPETQRMKSGYPESYMANAWLDTLEETADKTWKALQSIPGTSEPDQFRKMFLELKPRFSSGFFDVFYVFMESGSSRWSTSTFQKVKTIYKHLREFEDQTGYQISFHNLNEDFLTLFTQFYYDKGNKTNTTYKAVNIIVWFLNWAFENGYNVHTEYRRFYKLIDLDASVSRAHPFLQWEELMNLKEYITEHRKKERIRDLFCFMCFTGLRFSELQRLKKEDVGKDEVVVKKQDGKIRRLPLNKFAREIHGRYDNKFYLNNTAFPSVSLITFNKYLRLIGKEAGLERLVISSEGEGPKVPLYSRLTAGIAINTFIANSLELDVPVEIISGFTGVQNDSRVRRIKMDLSKEEMKKYDDL